MEAIEGLRYRARDAMKTISHFAVREARRKELNNEILTSEKVERMVINVILSFECVVNFFIKKNKWQLKAHFEDNPRDLAVLRHDKNLLHPRRIHSHMRHIPTYLLPKGG